MVLNYKIKQLYNFFLVCGKWDLNENVSDDTFCTNIYLYLSQYLEGFMAIVCGILDLASIIKFNMIYSKHSKNLKMANDKKVRRQEKLMLIQVKIEKNLFVYKFVQNIVNLSISVTTFFPRLLYIQDDIKLQHHFQF